MESCRVYLFVWFGVRVYSPECKKQQHKDARDELQSSKTYFSTEVQGLRGLLSEPCANQVKAGHPYCVYLACYCDML